MMRLSREVRFNIVDVEDYVSKVTNSWSGSPSTHMLVPRLSLLTTVQGMPDERRGYICNIKLIDDLIRDVIEREVIPVFKPDTSPELILRHIYSNSLRSWADPSVLIHEQSLVLSPYLKFTINSEEVSMVSLTQQFEFSASHRLHNPELSDEENRELFGKCNNPNGHGHNYVVEISLKRALAARKLYLPAFEAKVKELVIDRLDHKHLNVDVDYFKEVNPSVENIAIAIWEWLDGQFGDDQLGNVRVYETPKTWADYCG